MPGRSLLACVALLTAWPAAAAPPLAAYGHLPSVDLIAISPDGSKVALIVGDDRSRELQIRGTADMALIRGTPASNAKVRALYWAGEHHVLAATTTTERNVFRTRKHEEMWIDDFDLTKNTSRRLLDGGVPGLARVLTNVATLPVVRIIDDKPVAFIEGITFPSRRGVLALIRTDLDSGHSRFVTMGSATTEGWLLDPAGQIAARVDHDDASGEWTLSTGHDGHLVRTMRETDPIDTPDVMGFGRDANTVLVSMPGEETTRYREVALGSDRPSAPVAVLDGGAPLYDPRTHAVIGVRRAGGLAVGYAFFAAADIALWGQVTRAFPHAVVNLESWSDDHKKIVLKVEGGTFGAAFFLLDTATRHADWIADEYREVTAADVLERRLVAYPAADGLSIPAYLTLPPGAAKALPLVVLVHGGPGARDDAGFDWWSQALASRGYAVLQPQFRGSTGFGERLHAAGYGEWGRKMQTDLSDGVKFLADAGTIDPARVAIVGASYGGYAALAGVTLQSGIYRAAVSLAGPSDLRPMLVAAKPDIGTSSTLRFWQRFMGAASPGDPVLDTISPAKAAAKATVPVLLLHGADDTVVPFAQSTAMATALTRAGHPTQVVTLKGEDHWLSRSETRTTMLTATADFLALTLPVTPR